MRGAGQGVGDGLSLVDAAVISSGVGAGPPPPVRRRYSERLHDSLRLVVAEERAVNTVE